MGDIADDMLDGIMCEVCGEIFSDMLPDDFPQAAEAELPVGSKPPGYPRTCKACKAEVERAKKAYSHMVGIVPALLTTIDALRLELGGTELCLKGYQESLQVVKEERNTLREQVAELEKLKDVLAIIHRDGGHYTVKHGIKKSTEDAHLVWVDLITKAERAEKAIETLIFCAKDAHAAGEETE